MPAQFELKLAPRPAATGQRIEGAIDQCGNGRRAQKLRQPLALEDRSNAGRAGVSEGLYPNNTLLAIGQHHQIPPRRARRFLEFPNRDRFGRKKSRGATHDEPW
jgi:hypothetical protein